MLPGRLFIIFSLQDITKMKNNKFTINFYGETNMGMVRKNNEDTFICQNIWDKSHVLCAAIDGLGGYEGGEIAAAVARDTIISRLEAGATGTPKYGTLLKEALIDANNEIIRQHQLQPKVSQMGCVASVGLIDLVQGIFYVAHVGDSRIYRYADGQLTKLTHDHSLVGYREETGEMSEEAAMNHPKRNEIDRFLGEQELSLSSESYVENTVFPISGKTQFLFCSDGLTDLVTSSQISNTLAIAAKPEQKVKSLIADANAAGGKDNITVVIASLRPLVKSNMTTPQTGTQAPAHADTDTKEEETETPRGSLAGKLLWFIIGLIIGAAGYYAADRFIISKPKEVKAIIAADKTAPADTTAQNKTPGDTISIPGKTQAKAGETGEANANNTSSADNTQSSAR